MYINIIDMIDALAVNKEPLETRDQFCGGTFFGSKIVFGRIQPEFQEKQAIWALYRIGMNVIQNRLGFHKLYAGVFMHNRMIGYISFQLRDLGLGDCSISGTNQVKFERRNTPALRSNTGTVTDIVDKKFSIEYHLDGPEVDSEPMFMAFLEGMSTAALHDNNDTCKYYTIWSPDRRVCINIRSEKDGEEFTWARVRQTLSVIWVEIIFGYYSKSLDDPRWRGMNFLIDYEGKAIGDGFIAYYDTPVASSVDSSK